MTGIDDGSPVAAPDTTGATGFGAPPPARERVVPARMLGAGRTQYGPTGTIEICETATPVPTRGEVLVEVQAAGVDRGVWHLMTGLPYLMRLAGFGVRRPRQPLLGMDVAGRVVAVGPDVTRPRVGDAVLGVGTGTYAEYARARADQLVAKPAALSFVEAAAAPTSGLTALQAVHEIGAVRAGQRVLVLGASGGVGSLAVQLARLAGAEVTGVASAAKRGLVRSLGATHVLDYTATDPCDGSRHYELILDIGGRTRLAALRRALTPAGTLVIVGGENGGRWTGGIGRQLRALAWSPLVRQRLTTFLSTATPERLEQLRAELQDGLTPHVERTYPLADVPRALQDLHAGRIRGKAVIELRPARAQAPERSAP